MERTDNISKQTRDLFLDPKTDIDEITRVKRPEGVGILDVFSSDPAKRRAAFFGESKVNKKDLFKLLKDDEQFKEEFDAAEDERALRERQEAKQDKAEGGLLNKPKRNPKKPRGKGLGSK
jgi:hypothetical protein